MLGKKIVLKIAKEKVNKNFMMCKHNIELLFYTILKYIHKTSVNLSINLLPEDRNLKVWNVIVIYLKSNIQNFFILAKYIYAIYRILKCLCRIFNAKSYKHRPALQKE